ncbi:mediator of RNA polymerase II transcription subunit 1-domain-containing protein [Myxozyma melibiosi]|uniref:Mediator of RNA polymerase II transcription subunit 1 n=1 Tax=Myxozyma melibiosi TaxID=54550 RepID=A0ABR1F8P1_9ASCO
MADSPRSSPFNFSNFKDFKVISSSEVTPSGTPDNFLGVSPAQLASFSPSALDAATNAVGSSATVQLNAGPGFGKQPAQRDRLTDLSQLTQLNAGERRPVFGRTKSEMLERREIEEVIDLIRQRPGTISEAGLARLARANQLDFFADDYDWGKRLTLGGKISVIDVDLQLPSNKVSEVICTLTSSSSGPQRQTVLYNNLQEPTLDSFARNVERFARLDRLSPGPEKLAAGESDNFQIIENLYKTALARIHKHECSLHLDPESEGHGLPVIDDDGVLGLSIWYWSRQHKLSNDSSTTSKEKWRVIVEIDTGRSGSGWGVLQNNDYIGSDIVNPNGGINWQEPDYSNLEDQSNGFVLVLDPPVLIPYYDAAILDPNGEAEAETIPTLEGTEFKSLYSRRTIYDRNGDPIEYGFSLSSARMPETRRVEKIYISHPRQIQSVFEILRQSIRVRSLIDSVFHQRYLDSKPSHGSTPSLESFLLRSSLVSHPNSMTFHIESPYGKAPKLSLLLPTKDMSVSDCRISCFTFEIGRNGTIKVKSSSVNENLEYAGKRELEAALENGLNVSEDLGITGHWLYEQIQ